MIEYIEGGVTAPKDFLANGVLCKIKQNRTTKDVALIYSTVPCVAAGVFTKNSVQAEPVKLCVGKLLWLADNKPQDDNNARAIIVNSGNANACTGERGQKAAEAMCDIIAKELKISSGSVLPASTGVIGQQLDTSKIKDHAKELVQGLSKAGHTATAQAIITTDTHIKECAIKTTIAGKTVTIGAVCKGSGMIHINMGTMLCFITTDCSITYERLNWAIKECVEDSFNCVSVDGDTSTNDTLLILANGQAKNKTITQQDQDYRDFVAALKTLCIVMAKKIAADGEGASRLIECCVTGAEADRRYAARAMAKSVVSSSLVKAAIFGKDANWGRILCALGYSGQDYMGDIRRFFELEEITIYLTSLENSKRYFDNDKAQNISGIQEGKIADGAKSIKVFENGVPVDFDEAKAKDILEAQVVGILIQIKNYLDKGYTCYAWGCDLTYEYVKINGDYRT